MVKPRTLYAQLAERDTEQHVHAALVCELKAKKRTIDPLSHEMAVVKRWHFDRCSEQTDAPYSAPGRAVQRSPTAAAGLTKCGFLVRPV